jgi:tetratricopeptide (TPR) repeat protein
MNGVNESANSANYLLSKLGISQLDFKKIKSIKKKVQYKAVKNYINKAQSSDKVTNYTEVIHHLCQLQHWEGIKIVLNEKIVLHNYYQNQNQYEISTKPYEWDISIPMHEYLIFNQKANELLKICQEILNFMQRKENKNIFWFVNLLKAKAMSQMSETLEEGAEVFQEIINSSECEIEIYVEALMSLGIRRVRSGLYQQGIQDLHQVLSIIDREELNERMKSLKTEVLETLAFFEMNSCRFQSAIQLYSDVIEDRKQLRLFHQIAHPYAHQGIAMRKSGDYEQARIVLEAAMTYAYQENVVGWIEHHLAFVFLNQGNLDAAKKYSQDALESYKKFEGLAGIADCYEQIGLIKLAEQKFDEAEKDFQKSLNIRRQMSNRHGAASSMLDLSVANWSKRKLFKAIYYGLWGLYWYFRLGILNTSRLNRILKFFTTQGVREK